MIKMIKKIRKVYLSKIEGRHRSDLLAQLIVYALTIVSGIFIGAYVARYLGPSELGIMSILLTLAAIAVPLLDLGTHSILVKKFSQKSEEVRQLFWSVFWAKLALSGFLFLVLYQTVRAGIFSSLAGQPSLIIFLGLSVILISAVNQFRSNIVAAVQNRALMKGQITCLSIGAILRAGCVYFELTLEWFLGANLVIIALGNINVLMTAIYYKLIPKLTGFSFRAFKESLGESWPLILSGVAILLFNRIDMVMIDYFLTEKDIGHYWVSLRLLETLCFLPVGISTTLSSKIYQKLKTPKIEKQQVIMQAVFASVAVPSLVISVIALIGGLIFIPLLYGEEYSPSTWAFCIAVFGLPAVSLGMMRQIYITHEKSNKLSMYATSLALFSNVGMNIILIPLWGICGAAVATVLSLYVSSVLSTRLFFSKWLFKAQIEAFTRNPMVNIRIITR